MARILIVDDDMTIRQMLLKLLVARGHDVILAEDGAGGMRAYREQRPDLVIVDVVMPKKSGIEMVLELRDVDPRAKVIAMSGIAGPDFLAASREVGVARTLAKPFSFEEVMEVVEDVLRR